MKMLYWKLLSYVSLSLFWTSAHYGMDDHKSTPILGPQKFPIVANDDKLMAEPDGDKFSHSSKLGTSNNGPKATKFESPRNSKFCERNDPLKPIMQELMKALVCKQSSLYSCDKLAYIKCEPYYRITTIRCANSCRFAYRELVVLVPPKKQEGKVYNTLSNKQKKKYLVTDGKVMELCDPGALRINNRQNLSVRPSKAAVYFVACFQLSSFSWITRTAIYLKFRKQTPQRFTIKFNYSYRSEEGVIELSEPNEIECRVFVVGMTTSLLEQFASYKNPVVVEVYPESMNIKNDNKKLTAHHFLLI